MEADITTASIDINRLVRRFYETLYDILLNNGILLSSGHRAGKGQFFFQSQRKAMPKNVQTTAQLHSSHTLGK